MPKFLEKKLKKEYPNEPAAPFKIMNKLGLMKGNKETAKGHREEKKHSAHEKALMKARAKSAGGSMKDKYKNIEGGELLNKREP